MTCIKLRLKQLPPLGTRLDLSQLTSQKLEGLSLAEVSRTEILVDAQSVPLGNWFSVSGGIGESNRSMRIEVEGELSCVDYLGTRLHDCEMVVEGSVGDHLGYAMTSGTIVVRGNAGRHCANQMRGGSVTILGDVSDYAAGARISDQRGMQGGRLVVQGKAGSHAGHRMRRGTMIIHGDVGPGLGMRMIAGTIAVCGTVAAGIGCGMRRGTILRLSLPQAHLTEPSNATGIGGDDIPGFTTAEDSELSFLPILLQSLRADLPPSLQAQLPDLTESLPRRGMRCQGDRSISGLGEIISL